MFAKDSPATCILVTSIYFEFSTVSF